MFHVVHLTAHGCGGCPSLPPGQHFAAVGHRWEARCDTCLWTRVPTLDRDGLRVDAIAHSRLVADGLTQSERAARELTPPDGHPPGCVCEWCAALVRSRRRRGLSYTRTV